LKRSAGKLLVSKLQGVEGTLTDPAIYTSDPEQFKLADTNLGEAGMKFFFATHSCNGFCKKLGLETSPARMMSGTFLFRTDWAAPEDGKGSEGAVCVNKLCRKVASAGSWQLSL